MPVTSRADVLAVAPELSSIPEEDTRWTAFIEEAELGMNASIWGRRLSLGAKYLVAHRMTESKSGGSGSLRGEVLSETVGGVSRTYASGGGATGGGSSAYASTSYGREYFRLMKLVAGGPR